MLTEHPPISMVLPISIPPMSLVVAVFMLMAALEVELAPISMLDMSILEVDCDYDCDCGCGCGCGCAAG